MKYISLIFVCICSLAFGQDKTAFSLQEAQQYAVQNSYSKKIAEIDLEIAEKKVSETMAIGFPKLSGKVDFSNFIDIPTQVFPATAFNAQAQEDVLLAVQFGTDFSMSAGVTLNQLLFDGSYFVGLKAAKAFSNLSNQTLQKSEADIKADVANAYYAVLVAEENAIVLDSSYKILETIFTETKAMNEAGLLEKQDADQMELNVLALENSMARAKKQAELARDLLKMQMGISIEKTIELTENLETLLKQTEASTLMERDFSLKNHIEYKMVESGVMLQELNLKNVKMGYLPSAGAFVTHSQNAFRNEFDFLDNKPWFPTTIWGVSLNVPIFDFGVQLAKVKQAKLELEKTRIQQTQISESLTMQVKRARNDYILAQQGHSNQKRNLTLAESIYKNTLIKYKEGVSGSMELAQSQNQFFTTQANYINTIFQLVSAKTALDKALGNF